MKYGHVAVALAQLQLIGVAVAQPHRKMLGLHFFTAHAN